MAKPTVVVLPGAWIPLAGYATILRELRASCYQAQITAYPSLDPADPSKADCAADAIHIVENALKPLIEQDGKDVLLVMHSYASMPGIAAAKGYSKAQRVSGNKKGGVIGLVCLSAFLVPEGVSCSGAQGGSLPPWILLDTPAKGLSKPQDPEKMFCADQPPSVAGELTAILKPHATLAFNSPQPPLAWSDGNYKGCLGYIVATEDLAVPKAAQEGMMADTGQEWIVREIAGSHNAPFLSKVSETLLHLQSMIDSFEKA